MIDINRQSIRLLEKRNIEFSEFIKSQLAIIESSKEIL